ncbi:MAG: glycosyltransferase family 4 protein [Candidatus Auribacterota bacterium]|jgi:glycosyltransferase involved in cell wall biosynthesis|nr:glycosyltransferase family 4 protein [Candidatus Auribacterota bacterium]
MNITYLINTLSEGKGIPNRVAALAVRLDELGESVSIVTFDRGNRELPDTVGVHEPRLIGSQKLPFRFVSSGKKLFFAVASHSISREFKKTAPQVVCVDYTPLDIFANSLKNKFGYKVLYTYHGTADPAMYEGAERQKRTDARLAIHREAAKADLVMAVSEYTKKELAHAGIDSVVMPNGVDLNFFKPDKTLPNLHKKNPVLVYVGRYTEHKGVLNMLRAFVKLRKTMPEAMLYMFARHESKPYVAKIRSFIRESGIDGSVCMFRDIYGEILPYIYNLGDIFVSGALDETFGMTFVEAAACGTPCVAFASKSIPEVVQHEHTGLLSEPGDIDGLAGNMARILGDKQLRAAFSKNSVAFAKRYDWGKIAEDLRQTLTRFI